MLIQVYPCYLTNPSNRILLNGKITPAVLFPLMPNRDFLIKFWKCQMAVSILPHEAKALLELFCLQPIVFDYRHNSSSSSLAS